MPWSLRGPFLMPLPVLDSFAAVDTLNPASSWVSSRAKAKPMFFFFSEWEEPYSPRDHWVPWDQGIT